MKLNDVYKRVENVWDVIVMVTSISTSQHSAHTHTPRSELGELIKIYLNYL